MKNLKLLRILAVGLGIMISVSLVNAQAISKTPASNAQVIDKQEYYRQKQETATATPPSAAVKYEQEKMQNYTPPVQAPKMVQRNGTPITKVNTPSNSTLVTMDAKSRMTYLRDIAIAKGLSTVRYDEALNKLNNPKK